MLKHLNHLFSEQCPSFKFCCYKRFHNANVQTAFTSGGCLRQNNSYKPITGCYLGNWTCKYKGMLTVLEIIVKIHFV